MTASYDVVIVGAGASGLASAWYLCDKGLNVVVFEQGEKLVTNSIIPLEEGGELQKNKILNPNPNIRDSFADYKIDTSESPIDIANYNGIGGSTILFSAHYPRFHPEDFNVFTLDKVAVDWPLKYSELRPFYELNEHHTGLSGLVGDPKYPDIKPSMPPVPLGPMGRKIAEGFQALNWHWWPSYSAINTKEYHGRPIDHFQRPSNMGDFSGSRGSVENTYLPKAISKGLHVKEKCKVIRLIPDKSQKSISQVVYKDHLGNIHSCGGKVIIIAASGIGTPRLLLGSKSSNFPNGIGNSSSQIGRNLMLHPLGYVEGKFPKNLYSNQGPQGCCLLSQEFSKTDNKRDFVRGYTFQALRGPLPIEAAINLLSSKQINLGNDIVKQFLSKYNHTAHLAIITEDLPELNNRVLLDPYDNSDDLPGVKIKYKLSENTKKMLTHGLGNGRKILKKAGAIKTFAFGPVRYTGWHTLGTCRMGNNPKNSVVNKDGKSHDFDNLFIVDASIFPTSSSVNPASTIQALALYISSKILIKYKNLFTN